VPKRRLFCELIEYQRSYFLLTPRLVPYRTLTTRTPGSLNPHEFLALSAEYSVIRIAFFVERNLY